MANAKKEFLEHIGDRLVTCAKLNYGEFYNDETQEYETTHINLPVSYTPEQYQEFLKSLDFKYDDGYGAQNLFGTIWYNDGTWSSRGEYDGSEWWEYNKCPEIPNFN